MICCIYPKTIEIHVSYAVNWRYISLGMYSLSGKTSYHLEIGCYNDRITLKFERHLRSHAGDVPVKFQNELKSLNPTLAASRLYEILR